MQGSPATVDCNARRSNALAAIDRVLEERPQAVQAVTLALTHCVVSLRDELIAQMRTRRSDALARELAHVNALLSLVFSIQYPLEGVPWEKLKDAREALAKVIAETSKE